MDDFEKIFAKGEIIEIPERQKVNVKDPVYEARDIKKMVLRPDLWPQRPILPLKRRSPHHTMGWQMGALIEDEALNVWDVEIFSGVLNSNQPVASYATPADLAADGWEVD